MNFRLIAIYLGLAVVMAHAHEAEEETIARVTAKIRLHPDSGELYVHRATLHLERRDWQACLIDLERGERLHQRDLSLLQARALVIGKHLAHAVAVLQPLSSDPAALMVRARAQAALTNARAAADDFECAIRLMPQPEPDHFIECAELLCRANRRNEALALLNRAPQTPVIVERAMKLETPGDALKRLNALIVASAIKEPLLAKKAVLLAQCGRETESVAVWQMITQRIAAMPEQARGSHAMSKLMIQTQQALAALRSEVASRSP